MRCGLQHQRLQKESLFGVTSRSTREEKECHIIAADVSIESGAMTRGAAAIRPLAVIGRRRTSASRLAPGGQGKPSQAVEQGEQAQLRR